MKKLIYNKTILLFLDTNDIETLEKGDLKKIKDDYLLIYDNCVIFSYFDIKYHKNIIKDKINKLKFIKQTKINARECNIVKIDNVEKNKFLNENHLQETDRSQIFYGAYYNNELLAVMTFDNSRKMNGGVEKDENEYDLSRFAIKMGYIIVGVFNKMLMTFINDYSPNKIITFADLDLVNRENNIYLHNNFKLCKVINPDFRIYLKNKNNIFHKFTYGNKFMKDGKISDEKKEDVRENMIKLWNCGKIKYELLIINKKIIYGFIYIIKNKTNGKIYIGQTTRSFTRRLWEYRSAYKYNNFHNQYLANAFNKYGWDNFEISVIDNALTVEELNEKEINYINKYNSNNREFGYNLEAGGNNSLPSSETLEKMSISHQGVVQSDEWVEKRIAKAGTEDAKKYGKAKTEEEKLKLSLTSTKFWEGKTRDEETRRKISETKKKNGLSEKQKELSCVRVCKVNSKTNEIVETFESVSETARRENTSQATIIRRCSGETKNVGDYFYYYESDFSNNIVREFKSTERKSLNNFTEEELHKIYNEHINDGVSVRELCTKYNLIYSTLSNYISKKRNPLNLDSKYWAVCKKTNKKFEDYLNKSGVLTRHIQEIYAEENLESKFSRKKIELESGHFWYARFFDFIEIK